MPSPGLFAMNESNHKPGGVKCSTSTNQNVFVPQFPEESDCDGSQNNEPEPINWPDRSMDQTRRVMQTLDEPFEKFKSNLLEQLVNERQSLNERHKQEILSIRKKHFICEQNFKKQLDDLRKEYDEFMKTCDLKQQNYQERIKTLVDAESQMKKQVELDKQKHEILIRDHEKLIGALKSEKSKLEAQIPLLQSEVNNLRKQLDEESRAHKNDQEKDRLENQKLKQELTASNIQVSSSKSKLDDLSNELFQLRKNFVQLLEEANKLRDQLTESEKTKQDKSEAVHSLTIALRESKDEIEMLRNNFAQLEMKRLKEVEDLETQLNLKKANYEQSLEKYELEKTQMEKQHKLEIELLEREYQECQTKRDELQLQLQEKFEQFQTLKDKYNSEVEMFTRERESFNERIDQIAELYQNLDELSAKYKLSQNELAITTSRLATVEKEFTEHTNKSASSQENFKELEIELQKCNQLFLLEKTQNNDKSKQIESLKEMLSSSQSQLDRLTDENRELKMRLQESDKLQHSIGHDCEALRTTLAEVEKSRLEIKAKLNNSQFTCITLDSKLKIKDNEVTGLQHKIETMCEERKLLKESLDSVTKSLEQVKEFNEQLHQQNVMLQRENSNLETERYKIKSNSDKEVEMIRIKRESDFLKERISKLEIEKLRLERKLRNNQKRTESTKSPSVLQCSPGDGNSHCLQGEHSRSLLSLTQLVSEPSFLNTSGGGSVDHKVDTFSEDVSKVIRNIEAIEHQNIQMRKKLACFETMIDTLSGSECDFNSVKRSEEHSAGRTNDSSSIKSVERDQPYDYNGNYHEDEEETNDLRNLG